MINDVSKSTISGLGHIKKQNDKTTATIEAAAAAAPPITITETTAITIARGTNTGTTSPLTKYSVNCSEGGNQIAHDVVVHSKKIYNNHNNENNNSSYYADNEQQRNFEITSLNEANRENLSLANEDTLVDLISKQQQQQQQQPQQQQKREQFSSAEAKGESRLTVKTPLLLQNFNKRMRNKNITVIPFDDSYQRTLDLDAFNAAKEQNSQCELLDKHQQKDYKIDCELKFKSLAERKAILKKEFFKDLNDASTNTTTASVSTSSAAVNTVKLKFSNQTPLNKRILKKQHNLKLKIPKDCNKQPIVDSSSQSLVALRKLDLQKRQQTESRIASTNLNNTNFPKVKELAKRFDHKQNMIVPQTKTNIAEEAKTSKFETMAERQSPMSDEGCNIGQSPYSSDDDNDSIRTTNTAIRRMPDAKPKEKVARSASSDSALGLEVDEPMDTTDQQPQINQQKRRMTLTVTDLPLRPALLPLAEPTLLPDSPILDSPLISLSNSLQQNQNQIPSKVLLEERVVEIPEDTRSGISSRRESSQSCFSDFPPGEMQGVRFVRTPSVVVSDYSDDVNCGITLEEIEYFRAQRLRQRRSSLETSGTEKDALDSNSDISASSSCSNLYYCGSTISALDGAECLVNGVRQQLERKTSDCSTCSISGDEDPSAYFSIPEQPEDCQDITDMLANQHINTKRSKKVGKVAATLLTVDTNTNTNTISNLNVL